MSSEKLCWSCWPDKTKEGEPEVEVIKTEIPYKPE